MLRIKGWEQYENSRTRQYDKLDWVPVPNTMDGDGYTALLDHKHGAAHLAAWYTLLAVASRRPRGLRGTLLRDCGKPHDAHSLSRMTRIPAAVYQEAIPRLLSPEIGWLEEFQQADSALTASCQQTVSEPSASRQGAVASRARRREHIEHIEENTQNTPVRATTGTDNFELFRTAYESLPKATNEQDWMRAVHEWISHDDDYEAQTEAILEYMRWEARNGWRDLIAAKDGRFIPAPVNLLRSRAWTRTRPPEPERQTPEYAEADWAQYPTDDLEFLLSRGDCPEHEKIRAIIDSRKGAA